MINPHKTYRMKALTIIIAGIMACTSAMAQDTFKALRMVVSDFKLWSSKQLKAKYDEIRKFF